jgi:imidazolonepropionase-like amidohydrolase
MSSSNNGEAGRRDEATENAVVRGIRRISQGSRPGASNGGYESIDDQERLQLADRSDSPYQRERAASSAKREMSISQSRKISTSSISAGIRKISQIQQQRREEEAKNNQKMNDLKKDLEMVGHVIIIIIFIII